MQKRKRLSKGFRKWLRQEKARIRHTIHSIDEREQRIRALLNSLPKKK